MIRKIAKGLGLFLAALALVGAALYAFGVRIVMYGGGTPHVVVVESEAARAERIVRHRATQRAAPETAAAAAEPRAADPVAPAPRDARPAVSAVGAAPAPTTRTDPAPYWTDFRGPRRDGHYSERPILTNWPPAGLRPIWKQPGGAGYGSFAIARGRAFTIEQRGSEEVAAAYDVATGRERWTSRWSAAFREVMGGDGPRSTPTWADGLVYVQGATGELRCLEEATGRLVWRTNILADAGAANLQWGMAVSPLIVDDTVVVLPGGPGGQSVVAYDRRTGKRAWSALGDRQAYSSPMLVTVAGVRQILVFAASRLMGISADRGTLLWEYPWKTQFDVNAGQPLLVGDNRIFISTGYGSGAAVVEIAAADGRLAAREVWRNTRMKNQFSSSVLLDGYIYGLDEAILACVDAATGELKWKGGRYGYGEILLASGHLVVLSEDGDLALVRATPEGYRELARFAALEGKTWNHPAMADGYLLVRNTNEMAAFDLRLPAPTERGREQ
jgi:outer membrane protein assembly factor BamB